MVDNVMQGKMSKGNPGILCHGLQSALLRVSLAVDCVRAMVYSMGVTHYS